MIIYKNIIAVKQRRCSVPEITGRSVDRKILSLKCWSSFVKKTDITDTNKICQCQGSGEHLKCLNGLLML